MAYTYLEGVQLLQAVNTIMLAYCGAAWRDILHIQVLIIRPIINSFLHWEIHDTRTHPVRSLHQALAGVARTLGRALSYYALQCHWWLATTSVSLIPTKLNKIWLAKYNMILVQSRAIIRPCCVCRSTIPSILWSPELLCSLAWKVPSAYFMGIIIGVIVSKGCRWWAVSLPLVRRIKAFHRSFTFIALVGVESARYQCIPTNVETTSSQLSAVHCLEGVGLRSEIDTLLPAFIWEARGRMQIFLLQSEHEDVAWIYTALMTTEAPAAIIVTSIAACKYLIIFGWEYYVVKGK